MKPEDLLRESAQLLEDRAAQRDQPNGERSMRSAILAFNAVTNSTLTEREGWVFMVLLKMVRAQYGKYVLDDYADMAAYAALANEAAKPHDHNIGLANKGGTNELRNK